MPRAALTSCCCAGPRRRLRRGPARADDFETIRDDSGASAVAAARNRRRRWTEDHRQMSDTSVPATASDAVVAVEPEPATASDVAFSQPDAAAALPKAAAEDRAQPRERTRIWPSREEFFTNPGLRLLRLVPHIQHTCKSRNSRNAMERQTHLELRFRHFRRHSAPTTFLENPGIWIIWNGVPTPTLEKLCCTVLRLGCAATQSTTSLLREPPPQIGSCELGVGAGRLKAIQTQQWSRGDAQQEELELIPRGRIPRAASARFHRCPGSQSSQNVRHGGVAGEPAAAAAAGAAAADAAAARPLHHAADSHDGDEAA